MTYLTVPIMVRDPEHALAQARQAKALSAQLVEYRIDHFAEDAQAVIDLLARSPLPCILTCRPTWEGGDYAGDETDRLALLEAVCTSSHPPTYVDVEWAAASRVPRAWGDVGVILSSHDFQTRPADLLRRVADIADDGRGRVVKLAWRARSLRDNLEAFEIVRQQLKPTIALCMGEHGLASRVLAKKFGALLTFASLEAGTETAPGQPSVTQLKTLYRWDHLNANTEVFGVIGHPVGHSMSPPIHNAGFDALGYDGIYLPLSIPPEYEHFKATVADWLAYKPLHFRGASVTIPHKQNLLRFVAEQQGDIEPLARTIGAANTLTVRDDGSLYASNTDYAAALDAVCEGLAIEREQLAGKRIAILGAGGVARAIVAGFAAYGAQVTIYNRTGEKARALADAFEAQAGDPAGLSQAHHDVWINCTSLGMSPEVEATPLLTTPKWGPGTVVFDTIYNPIETRLLADAKADGCHTIPGTDMFTRQAGAQFALWTGQPAPREVFSRILLDHLAI